MKKKLTKKQKENLYRMILLNLILQKGSSSIKKTYEEIATKYQLTPSEVHMVENTILIKLSDKVAILEVIITN